MADIGDTVRRSRVLHIITLLELGGAQQNTLHTVRHLDRSRFEVALIAGRGGLLDDEARAIPDLDCRLLPDMVRAIAPAHDLRATRAIVAAMRELTPDIVHTHSSKAGIIGRLAAAYCRVPIVIHSIHGWGFTPAQSPPVRAAFVAAETIAARATTHFVAVSRANVTEGVRRGLLGRARTSVIRSGFPLAEFAAEPADRAGVRSELGLEPDCPLIGSISCLKPQKDPLAIVEVADRVLRAVPAARFVIAGDGALRAVVERRIEELGLIGRVLLLGWRRDVARLMAAFDLLLHTSRWEGLPRVVPQAMSVGLAVVATAVDGAPEVVRDGETGLLAPPRDVSALAAGVVRLLRDPQLRRRMGHRAAAVVDEFDEIHLVPAQERLYERLIGEREGRAA